MKRTMFAWPSDGRRMKRSSCCGIGSSAFMAVLSLLRLSSITMLKARLGMNGNGCAGSMAIGVTTGRM